MGASPYLWGVLGGLLCEAGGFALTFLFLGAAEPWFVGVRALVLLWGVACCILVGRWAARASVRRRASVVLVNGAAFAAVLSAPPRGSWYSADWLSRLLVLAVLATALVAVGYSLPHRHGRVASEP